MYNHNLKNKSILYSTTLSNGFSKLNDYFSNSKMGNKNILIITDSTVKRLYLKMLLSAFKKNKSTVFTFSVNQAEIDKKLDTCEKIYNHLSKNNFTRNDMIIAFGGGSVSDLAGFVAGTYMRGIDYAIIPTTLLSMCDASIGGKTAVNFGGIKNLIGVFKNPNFVYINVKLILSLNNRDYISGLVEVIKHAVISDSSFYRYIEKNKELILKRDLKVLKYIIKKSIEIKKEYVLRDPLDYDARHILNFGHTFGHAIESIENFRLSHGNCIAIGMKMAMEMTKFSETERIIGLFDYFGINTNYQIKNKKKIFDTIKKDKKRCKNKIKFVFLRNIGEAYIKEITI